MDSSFVNFVPPTVEHKAKVFRPRLFSTYYYKSSRDKAQDWLKVGHACTAEGAVRAAIMKLLYKTCAHVDIYNNDGVRVAIMTRQGQTIKVLASWM